MGRDRLKRADGEVPGDAASHPVEIAVHLVNAAQHRAGVGQILSAVASVDREANADPVAVLRTRQSGVLAELVA